MEPDDEFEEAYSQLQQVASGYLRSTGPLTLQTTSLVHEAYLKLTARSTVTIRGAGHAKALMARAMRQVLIDHIRRRRTAKHRPPEIRLVNDELGLESGPDSNVESMHRAIGKLELEDPASAQVLELAYFGGYRQAEIAEIHGVSDRTVRVRIQKALESLRSILGEAD